MKDQLLTIHNLPDVVEMLQQDLAGTPVLMLSTKNPKIGKWGMAKIWRKWMQQTGDYLAGRGALMPVILDKDGKYTETRAFNSDDAHELFTGKWLGVDEAGNRLSWSKAGREGMRAANRSERYHAMQKHQEWASSRGIFLYHPQDSELRDIEKETESV